MNQDYQEHELTAYLLGELDEARRNEIAEILKNSESARRELEEVKETLELVRESLLQPSDVGLEVEQRRRLQAAFDNVKDVGILSRLGGSLGRRSIVLRWGTPLAAAASLIVVLLLSWDTAKQPIVISPAQEQLREEIAREMQQEFARSSEANKQAEPAVSDDDEPAPPAQTEAHRDQKAADTSGRAPAERARSEGRQFAKTYPTTKIPANTLPAFKGQVIDQSGSPLPGASVQVASAKSKTVQSTLTDTRGQFAVPPLPDGEYRIRAAKSGFQASQVGPMKAEAGKTYEVRLALQPRNAPAQASWASEPLPAPPAAPTAESMRREKSAAAGARGIAGGVVGYLAPSPARLPGPPMETWDEDFNTESYDYQDDNEMTAVAKDPLSTFSIDVDTASYSNVRRFIREGRLPPPDAVRIEEMVNYFPYQYEPPTDHSPFSVHTEVAQAPWAPAHRLVRIALKGRELPSAERPDANLVFLLDVSGSMATPTKLPLVKQAMRLLVEELKPTDRVTIVVYAGASGLVLPSTPGSEKQRILDALERLQAGGSTNAGAGIDLAYREAVANFNPRGVNRVILATDGDFNVGITNQGELVRLLQQHAAKGVYLTALGFGMGNYKDSMLEKLADKGNGNYAYIDSLNEARKVLVEQIGGTLVTIAKDIKIQVEFNPLEVTAYRLIGYENRVMAHQDFDDDRKDAGEIGAGHTVTALYEVVPTGVPIDLPQGEPLKYQKKSPAATPSGELLTVKLRYKLPNEDTSRRLEVPVVGRLQTFEQASEDFRFAAAVAGFGMILRNSPFKGSATFQSMLEIAETSRRFDPQGYRADFTNLIREAIRLTENQ
ncbi:MAG TPA: von Willebrand factor type A domain-containing protein [Acidobacteriota bacterium]|nr:von Willebrand factor type A domain-containing protein [Acidobacteriota bacterium]